MNKNKQQKIYTIKAAIIQTLMNKHQGEATLQEIYQGVNKIRGEVVSDTAIRGVIYHCLEQKNRKTKYKVYFTKVAPATYGLINKHKII